MANPADLYVNGVRAKLRNHFAAWLPNQPLRLGDVGILKGKLFERLTNLSDIGISFDERPDPDPSSFELVSESGVSMVFKASGEINPKIPNIPQADAGIGVSFSQQGAFVLSMPESYEPSIENIAKLQRDIIAAYKQGRWPQNYVVIVRLVQAKTATILVSQSSDSSIEFSVKGDVTVPSLSLGDASLGMSIKAQSGDIFRMMGSQNATPIFQLAGLKPRTWSPVWDAVILGAETRTLMNAGQLPPAAILRNNRKLADVIQLDLVQDSDLI